MITDSEQLLAGGLMPIDEVVAYLAKSRSWVYAAMNDGRLPYTMVGASRRIPRNAVIRLAAQHLVEAQAEGATS